MQVYVKLCDLEQKFPKRRQTAADRAARSLQDKSSHVRRNAIKLLGKLVATHPFTAINDGLLSEKAWADKLQETDAQINSLKPPEELQEHPAPDEQIVDATLLQDATHVEHAAEQPKHPNEMTDEEKEAAMRKVQEAAATARSEERRVGKECSSQV